MKTDFTERLRDFLKSEGLEFRLNVDFDSQGNVEMIIASKEYEEDDFDFPVINTTSSWEN